MSERLKTSDWLNARETKLAEYQALTEEDNCDKTVVCWGFNDWGTGSWWPGVPSKCPSLNLCVQWKAAACPIPCQQWTLSSMPVRVGA